MSLVLGKHISLRILAGAALPFVLTVGVLTNADPAGADPSNTCGTPSDGSPPPDWCLDSSTGPGGGGTEAGSSGGGSGSTGGGSAGQPACGWVTISADRVPAANSTRPAIYTNGRPPEGMDVVWQGWCYRDLMMPGSSFRGPFRWLPATGAPAPPVLVTPADVAQGAYQAIQGRMPDPLVVTSPPVGVDATVSVPVFVTVTNWQPELVEVRPLLGDTVSVRATPTLVVSTGESGGTSRTCAGPGVAYDPAGGDLWAQASSPAACTLTYQRRTGVAGRPATWPSTVTVRWSISWSSTSGQGGTFPVVERAVSLPRSVSEVQTVGVGGEG